MNLADSLLTKAPLVPTAPYTDADIEAAELRLARRVAARTAPYGRPPTVGETARPASPPTRSVEDFAADLRTVCEAVLTQPRALEVLHDFLARHLPTPGGAAVLGSILHLSGAQDSARFWWQYAAGAGDPPAAYCLYLHHQSHGEKGEARWWYSQSDLAFAPMNEETTELERTLALRLLRRLKDGRGMPASLAPVMAYVPTAVGYVDEDLELPLPEADFTQHIQILLDRARDARPSRCATQPVPEGNSRSPERTCCQETGVGKLPA